MEVAGLLLGLGGPVQNAIDAITQLKTRHAQYRSNPSQTDRLLQTYTRLSTHLSELATACHGNIYAFPPDAHAIFTHAASELAASLTAAVADLRRLSTHLRRPVFALARAASVADQLTRLDDDAAAAQSLLLQIGAVLGTAAVLRSAEDNVRRGFHALHASARPPPRPVPDALPWPAPSDAANARVLSLGCPVFRLALLPGDGIACAGWDGRIILADARSFSLARSWPAHDDPVICLAPGPGGLLASGSWDTTVKLWDISSGERLLHTMEGHAKAVDCVAVTPDCRLLASGSDDTTVRVWDVATGRLLCAPLTGHKGGVYCSALSKEGKLLVTGGGCNEVLLWDLRVGQRVGEGFTRHMASVRSVAFMPDENRIVSGSAEKYIRVWDVRTRQQIGDSFRGHTDWVYGVDAFADGRRVVSGGKDATVRLWDVDKKQEVCSPMLGHQNWVYDVKVMPSGDEVLSGSRDGTLRLWKI